MCSGNGDECYPRTMANAAPGNAAATPAPTVPVVAQATDPVVTAAPGQTENIMPNQPTEGNTLPADGQVIGQVMPGVRGERARRRGQCAVTGREADLRANRTASGQYGAARHQP